MDSGVHRKRKGWERIRDHAVLRCYWESKVDYDTRRGCGSIWATWARRIDSTAVRFKGFEGFEGKVDVAFSAIVIFILLQSIVHATASYNI